MEKNVTAGNGRRWRVSSSINWAHPATQQPFEHDVAAGHVPGIVMLVVLVVMALSVLFWTPANVVVPSWLVLFFLLVLMLLPMQWALDRPWTIKAETADESVDISGERWVGTVHGMMSARQEISRVTRYLEVQNVPDSENGRLKLVQ